MGWDEEPERQISMKQDGRDGRTAGLDGLTGGGIVGLDRDGRLPI
jgi:hypothetical protein